MLIGVDVSSYQGQPNWQLVADSGRSFGITKATEGTGYINPYFAFNWANIKGAGLVRGAYHFARPELNSAVDEAAAFLRVVNNLQESDILALDLEVGSGDLLDWALTWLSQVEQQVGFKPLLYSGTWFLGPHGCLGSNDLAQYGLWLSGYQANQPAVPNNWTTMAMWQYTDKANCPGINTPVDQSYFLGDLNQLKQYGKQGVIVPTTIDEQLVTILSVIGDATYPDASNIDDQMPNQPDGVSKRIFIRELVQQAKALLGA